MPLAQTDSAKTLRCLGPEGGLVLDAGSVESQHIGRLTGSQYTPVGHAKALVRACTGAEVNDSSRMFYVSAFIYKSDSLITCQPDPIYRHPSPSEIIVFKDQLPPGHLNTQTFKWLLNVKNYYRNREMRKPVPIRE